MDPAAARQRVNGMVQTITNEAAGKAKEIEMKGEEEFNIEVHRLITEQKEKLKSSFDRKLKQIETQYAIKKSMAINKQRLEKIKARQEVYHTIAKDVQAKLAEEMKSEGKSKEFVTKLVTQGLLMLLESEVTVKCRQQDAKMLESCLAAAVKDYSDVILKQTGAKKACKATIDKTYLPPTCLGGVVLSCHKGLITIDNTLDARLKLVMEQDKPTIRGLLFPEKRK